jgi:protein-S-isoprenylcysteine O-methyltransferase Ste14
MARILNPDDDSAKVGFPPPFVYLGFWLLGLLIDRLGGFALPLQFSSRVAGAALLVPLGLMLILAAQIRFGRAKIDPKPWKTTDAFVRSGIYRFTRNPMYLGMALAYLGLVLGTASLSGLLLFPVTIAAIHTQVIAREERYLTAKFGEQYLEYKAHVRRWL